jgi:hypothetical protein
MKPIKFWLTLDEVIWKFKTLNEYLKRSHYKMWLLFYLSANCISNKAIRKIIDED